MRKRNLSLVLLGFSLLALAQQQKLPNIVFILADDLGYGDLSCLNNEGKINTPHLDEMAKQGVVFINAHSNSAVSTPTRYGVLTGRYAWRSSLKQRVLKPYGKPIITSERTTLPKMLKQQGYHTACIGKWHLGMTLETVDGQPPIDNRAMCNIDFTKKIKEGPCDIGFEYYFGIDAPNYPPYGFIQNRDFIQKIETYYPADLDLTTREGRGAKGWDVKQVLPALEKEAIAYINGMAKNDKPFFLYFPVTSPHAPIVPTDDFINRSQLNQYADFVIQTDALVGAILDALKNAGKLESTIVVFTSDNGCSPSSNYPLLKKKGHNPSYIFRGMKSDLFEGGHHVPCIVYYPKEYPPHFVTQTICLTDFMSTFASFTGYKLSDNEAEDSCDITPLLCSAKGTDNIRESTVYHSIDGSFAIQKGNWKLLLTSSSGGWSEPRNVSLTDSKVQLYDLKDDPRELNNLCEHYPDRVSELKNLLIRYVENGRSTPGTPQRNEGRYSWEKSAWVL